MRLSVVGLGKLGAPLAACFARRGHTVIGVDQSPPVVEAVNAGRAPVSEPGLAELFAAHAARISATHDTERAVAESEMTFVIVPTPSDPSGSFSLRHVLAAAEPIGKALGRKPDHHVVVLTSTVMPGATENELLPALESASGKRAGVDFGLCYNPEFIAIGSVVRDLLRPDFVLIGESDERAGADLEALYRSFLDEPRPVRRMGLVNAEITKLAVNTFVTTKIAYANMLSDLCGRIPGADVDVVTSAVGLDGRIGPRALKGATAYGGPCFPRDNRALAALARSVGTQAPIAEATDAVNRHQVSRLLAKIEEVRPPGGRVAILGLSYKPDTAVVEESPGLALASALAGARVPVTVHDPMALANVKAALGDAVAYAESARECLAEADVGVIMTPWREYAEISPRDFGERTRPPVVLDLWRLLDAAAFTGAARLVTLGTGPSERI